MQAIKAQHKEAGKNAWSGESEPQYSEKEVIHKEGGVAQGFRP